MKNEERRYQMISDSFSASNITNCQKNVNERRTRMKDIVRLANEVSGAAAQLETLACYVDAAFQEPPTVDRVSPELLCDTLRATAEHLSRVSDDLAEFEPVLKQAADTEK